MAKTPIDTLFDGVKWVPTGLTESESDLPVATHEGILHLFDRDFRVYELSNGMRIIHADDLIDFMHEIGLLEETPDLTGGEGWTQEQEN